MYLCSVISILSISSFNNRVYDCAVWYEEALISKTVD